MLTIRGYARHRKEKGLTGQTHGAVAKALDAGRIAMGADGLIDPDAADAAWEQNTDQAQQREPKRPGRAPKIRPAADVAGFLEAIESGKIPPFRVSQAAHEYYKAHKAKLDAAERDGELLPRKDTEREIGNLISAARSRLLGAGSKLAPVLAIETDPAKCQAIVDAEIYEALTEVSAWRPPEPPNE